MKKWRFLFFISLLIGALFIFSLSLMQDEKKPGMFGFESSESGRDWSKHQFFDEMEKLFNISFDFKQFSDEREFLNFKKSLLEGDEKQVPDVFFKARLSKSEQKKLYAKGLLVNLYPLLEKNAPNFYALLKNDENIRKAVEIEPGVIAALPYIDLLPNMNAMWLNKLWLQSLKLDEPKNAEELLELLKAFKNSDPNYNGKKDEKPLSFTGVYDLKYLAHAFSIVCDDFNLSYENGKVEHFSEKEGFRDFLKFLSELGKQKIIDADSLNVPENLRREGNAKAEKKYGLIIAPLPSHYVPNEWVEDFSVLRPLESKGERRYRPIINPIYGGCFAIGKNASNKEALLKWADYLYSEEGARLSRLGIEGRDYVMNGDGTWKLNENNRFSAYRASIEGSFDTPGVSLLDMQYKYQDKKVAYCLSEIDKLRPYVVKMPSFTEADFDDAAKLKALNARLSKLLDDFIGRVALNQIEVSDESLNELRQSLLDNGLDEFKKIMHEAVGGK